MSLAMTVIALTSYLAYRELCKIWREHDILVKYGNLFLTPEDIEYINSTSYKIKVPIDPIDRKSEGFCFANCSGRNFRRFPSFEEGVWERGDPRVLPSQEDPHNNDTRRNSSTAEETTGPQFMAMTQPQEQPVTHHACCNSRRRMIFPVRVKNIYGHDRLVVQFRNRKQAFFSDECFQARGCSGCQCTQMMATYAAIVIEDDGDSDEDDQPRRRNFAGYRLEMIRVPGCCKCLNNLT